MSKSDQIICLWLVVLVFTFNVLNRPPTADNYNKACTAMALFMESVRKPTTLSEMTDFTDEAQLAIRLKGIQSKSDLLNKVSTFIGESELKFELKDGRLTAGIKEDAALRYLNMQRSISQLHSVCSSRILPPDPSEISEEIIYLLDQVRTLD